MAELGPIKLNSATIQEILDGGVGMRDKLLADAQRVLGRARAAAPVDSGDYQRSLHIEETHTDRLVIRVVSDSPYARAVERKHRVLGKALAASSGRTGGR
jgi:hypothetical protein